MKYMGSKRVMLQNGLGTLMCRIAEDSGRVVDLFSGSGAVSWHAAEKTNRSVLASDLQAYARILAGSVIERTIPLDPEKITDSWLIPSIGRRNRSLRWRLANRLDREELDMKRYVREARAMCMLNTSIGPIWNAYGGYYYSPAQAITFDYLLKYLPSNEPDRTVCLASVLVAASICAAAPGHTAQPFRPTDTAGPYILEAWGRDPIVYCENALRDICPRHARTRGVSMQADAIDVVEELTDRDLVFIDPPYSGVQYSRFYHVLESIATGQCKSVEGAGRYPPISDRPQSEYCIKTEAQDVLEELLESLAGVGATIIFTVPANECSNGLSGDFVIETASEWFDVYTKRAGGRFSTLGGNNAIRDARQAANELILLMKPLKA